MYLPLHEDKRRGHIQLQQIGSLEEMCIFLTTPTEGGPNLDQGWGIAGHVYGNRRNLASGIDHAATLLFQSYKRHPVHQASQILLVYPYE